MYKTTIKNVRSLVRDLSDSENMKYIANNPKKLDVATPLAPVHALPSYNDVFYVKDYKLPEISSIVRKAKQLSKNEIRMIANSLYSSLDLSFSIKQHSERILLIHSPSTSFALSLKPKDQLAEILLEMKRVSDRASNKTSSKENESANKTSFTFDIAPYSILIKRNNRSIQHNKNKAEREASVVGRFEIISTAFARVMSKYDSIYIIDDVVTTGSTLAELKLLINSQILSYKKTSEDNSTIHLITQTDQTVQQIQGIQSIPKITCLAYCH